MLSVDLTDAKIAALIALQKQVTSKGRSVNDGKHSKRDFKLVGATVDEEFTVFVRQHLEMTDDFTAGLIWHARTGESVILMRCNGASHPHTNHLEGAKFSVGNYHIHQATERYIQSGRNAEHYAEITTDYRTVEGALHQLCKLCNIDGIATEPDSPSLF